MSQENRKEKVLNIGAMSPKKIFFAILLAAISLILGLTIAIYLMEANVEKTTLYESEQNRIEVMEQFIYSTLKTIGTDLDVASSHEAFTAFFETGDEVELANLANEYFEMSNAKGVYDQVRYIDENGIEKVRVNYNAGHPAIVAKDNLQDKSQRYYFEDTNSLNQDEVFVSPLDLNIENDEIEQPLKPVLRFGTPIFDKEANRKGVVLLNYLADDLLINMEQFYLQKEGELLMFNQDGYWISALNPEDEWGFMYQDRADRTVENTNPEMWKNIQEGNSGQFETKNGLITYTKILPLSLGENYDLVTSSEYTWTLVSLIESEQVTSTSKALLYRMLLIDAILFSIITFISWKLTAAIAARRKAEKNTVELNDLLKVINKIIRHDILGRLTGIRAAIEASELIDKNQEIADTYEYVMSSIQLIKQMKELEYASYIGTPLRSQNIKSLFIKIASEQKMTINITGDSQVMADEALCSVFENITRNAKIHSGVDTIDVEISTNKKSTIIKITDKGIGIAEEMREKIFEEGFHAGKTGHTGLGLYIVKKTIERYDGSIHIEPNYPKGTVFVIKLPS